MKNYAISFENAKASFTVRFKARSLAEAKVISAGFLYALDGTIETELGEI